MKDKFFAYYSYDSELQQELWKHALIVIDTNTLLSAYEMSEDAREQFFKVLRFDGINEKLWMPYQVGEELHRNRKKVIDGTLRAFKDTKSDISKMLDQLSSFVDRSALKLHKSLLEQIHVALDEFRTKTNTNFSEYKNAWISRDDHYEGPELKDTDTILDEIASIYEGKIGEKISTEDMIKLYELGNLRFSLSIPPGFKDDIKSDYKQFGDFILWVEMIEKAKQGSKPVIFITDDSKSDWWETNGNNKIPHRSLISEFHESTRNYLMMYNYENFIQEAKTRFENLPQTDKVSEQMKLLSQEVEEQRTDQVVRASDDAYLIHLQNLMNHANPTIANRAYMDYMRAISPAEKMIGQAMHYAVSNGYGKEAEKALAELRSGWNGKDSHEINESARKFAEWVQTNLVP